MTRTALTAVLLTVVLAGCTPQNGSDGVDTAVARGEAIYQASCMGCHGGAAGGAISDIPPRHNAEGHTWHHADCDLLDIIADGLPDRPGLPEGAPTMPAFGTALDADDRRAVLAFIKTWWTDEQRASQQRTTEQICDQGS